MVKFSGRGAQGAKGTDQALGHTAQIARSGYGAGGSWCLVLLCVRVTMAEGVRFIIEGGYTALTVEDGFAIRTFVTRGLWDKIVHLPCISPRECPTSKSLFTTRLFNYRICGRRSSLVRAHIVVSFQRHRSKISHFYSPDP